MARPDSHSFDPLPPEFVGYNDENPAWLSALPALLEPLRLRERLVQGLETGLALDATFGQFFQGGIVDAEGSKVSKFGRTCHLEPRKMPSEPVSVVVGPVDKAEKPDV